MTNSPCHRNRARVRVGRSRAIALLESVPYRLLALPLRVGAAAVFWISAQANLANWDTTLEQFAEEYKVPLLPPEIAAAWRCRSR